MQKTDLPVTNVTQTFLPPLAEYTDALADIWARGWVTNNGPLVLALEHALEDYLKVPHVVLTSSGTTALQIAIQALGLTGEVITTPFSYVATTASLVWQGAKPIFAGIDPETLVLDPQKIEAAITDKTTGILATHIYGLPCDVAAIEAIAKRHNLKVLYDAAHAFGVEYCGQSLFGYGDIAIASFHATKIFHTIEGGAVITANAEYAEKARYMRNHGHGEGDTFLGLGINGKCSELHAAMGLSLLPRVDQFMAHRQALSTYYDTLLKGCGNLWRPTIPAETSYNYAYYPIIFKNEAQLLKAQTALNAQNVFPRRYFYPSLSTLPYLSNPTPVPIADDIAKRVLCLPLSQALTRSDVERIGQILRDALLADDHVG